MKMKYDSIHILVVAMLLILSGPTAFAQEAMPPSKADEGETRPWAKGVSSESQSKAIALFEKGNAFFAHSQYPQALSEYNEAVKAWNHPAIRYNMAVCLINLDQPLEAYEHLVEGLAYNGAAITSELNAEGKTYMKLLKGRLSWLTISVKEPGTKVLLDGKELFVGPGRERRLMLPGKHQIIAQKALMLTETKFPVLEGGVDTNVVLTMRPLSEGVVMKRRWETWKPWTVAGSGVGVAAIGGLLYLLADSNYNTFDARVGEQCPMGCSLSSLPSDIREIESRADLQSTAASSLLITGGVLALTSGVLLFLNRQRPVTLNREVQPGPPALTIVPVLGPESIGLSSKLRF